MAHEAVVAGVRFLEQPVDFGVDVREELFSAAEDVFSCVYICFYDIEKPCTDTWPHGKLPGARRLPGDVDTTEPHEYPECLTRLV